MDFFGMNVMFSAVPVLIVIGFVFVFGTIIVRSVRGAKQWKKNNDSPVLTVSAVVAAKRADVSYHHHHHDNAMSHTTSSTAYYVTFQVESGDRMEFAVRDTEYGLLAEGDAGKLTFQGTRYLGFERQR
ncbi:MAG TPA: DUF2500 family protein [Feifaniaceae bacterium]|nr:DUF2500 family protein [Feifaniaceae bacterium]